MQGVAAVLDSTSASLSSGSHEALPEKKPAWMISEDDEDDDDTDGAAEPQASSRSGKLCSVRFIIRRNTEVLFQMGGLYLVSTSP